MVLGPGNLGWILLPGLSFSWLCPGLLELITLFLPPELAGRPRCAPF